MEQVNLGSVIEQAITRSSQNRLGEKPPVFVALAPVLPKIPWRDAALRRFLQSFLYESLLTSDANAVVEYRYAEGHCSKILPPSWGFNHRTGCSYGSLAGALRSPSKPSKIFSRKSAIAVKSGSASRAPTLAWAFSEPSTRPISKWFSVSDPHVINSAATCCCR